MNQAQHQIARPILLWALVLLSLASTTACRKEPSKEPVTNITINTPLDNATIKNGDTLFIKGSITSEVSIHGYDVTITSPGNNSTIYSTTGHQHGNNIAIGEYWVNTLQADKPLTLSIKAVIDHADKQVEKTIHIYSKP